MTRALTLLALMLAMLPAAAAAQMGCTFENGFKTIADQIPEIVGTCVTSEYDAQDGTTRQLTTGGYLVWRSADNTTSFASAAGTWSLGPDGVQGPPGITASSPLLRTPAVDPRSACFLDVTNLLAMAGAYGVAAGSLAAAQVGGEQFCHDAILRDGDYGYQCFRAAYGQAILRQQGRTGVSASVFNVDVEKLYAGCIGR
jgi:hypothetical protein